MMLALTRVDGSLIQSTAYDGLADMFVKNSDPAAVVRKKSASYSGASIELRHYLRVLRYRPLVWSLGSDLRALVSYMVYSRYILLNCSRSRRHRITLGFSYCLHPACAADAATLSPKP